MKSVTSIEQIYNSDLPVLVDFWAPWCQPCKRMEPVLEQLASDFEGRIEVMKLNVDDHPGLTSKFGVMSIPTFCLFAGEEEIGRRVGQMDYATIKAMVSDLLLDLNTA